MKYVTMALGGLSLIGLIVLIVMFVFENPQVAEGRQLFSYYCASCHGPKGRGNGYNVVNLDPKPRDLSDRIEPYMAEATNEDIFKAIAYGVAGAVPGKENPKQSGHPTAGGEEDDEPMGSPLMPFWGHTLTDRQVWSLVAYIRTLHKNDAPPVQYEGTDEGKIEDFEEVEKIEIPRSDSAEGRKLIAHGQHLFGEQYACTSCHQLGGAGGEVGPPLDRVGFRLQPRWIYHWIRNPQKMKPDTTMPSFAITHDDALAITLYLTTLRADGDVSASR